MSSGSRQAELDFTNLHFRGRETEIAKLQNAYDEAASQDSWQIVWLYGYSGVGKTTLVEHALGKKEMYCCGKYDRLHPTQPFYSALATLFAKLCFLLEFDYPKISMDPDDAAILAKIFPEINHVLDNYDHDFQGNNEDILLSSKPEWRIPKLREAFRSFLRSVCQVLKTPLIMYIDDLQWADVDSIAVIEALLTGSNLGAILFVGSYRDNEVRDDSPLRQCMLRIKKRNVTEIELSNLDKLSATQVVSDLTHLTMDEAQQLSDLLYSKSHGNPFFTLRILQHLTSKQLLYFSTKSGTLKWKSEKIRGEIDLCENVVEFMFSKLKALPAETIEVLKVAACLGSTVEMKFLRHVRDLVHPALSTTDLRKVLQIAIEEQLIEMNPAMSHFTFVHDRIHSAAYELIPSGRTVQSLHLMIGRHMEELAANSTSEPDEQMHVAAADQLNRGRELIDDADAKVQLARLNLHASEVVMKRGAFKMASTFLEAGIELLGIHRWNTHYSLTLTMSNALASVLFSNGFTDSCLCLVEEIYANALCREDRYKAQFIHVDALASISRLEECISATFKILRELGHPKIPNKPGTAYIVYCFGAVAMLLSKMTDEDLLSLPTCEDPTQLAAMKHLGSLQPVAFMAGREELSPVLICRMISISVRHGISEWTPYAFHGYGFAMTVLQNFDAAFRFATLALKMAERFPQAGARINAYVYGILHHIKKPLRIGLEHTLRSYHVAFSQGEMLLAGEASTFYSFGCFIAGMNLTRVAKEINSFVVRLNAYNQVHMCCSHLNLQRTVLELMGCSENMAKFTGKYLDDEAFEKYLGRAQSKMVVFMFWMFTMQARYTLGDMASAVKYGERCWRSKPIDGAFAFSAPYVHFTALTALEEWKRSHKLRYMRIFRKHYKQIQYWVSKGNPNAVHLLALLDAEKLTTRKIRKVHPDTIRTAFDSAISMATSGGFVHDAALANDRAGQYFARITTDGATDGWASHYLSNAVQLYLEWGAIACVRGLETKYGNTIHTTATTTTATSTEPSPRTIQARQA
jgi:predicted ATPase